MKPISPKEILDKRLASVPDFVIKAVNKLLEREYVGKAVRILQDDVIREAMLIWDCLPSKHPIKDTVITRSDFFDLHWLDFESLFEENGWERVTYCKAELDDSGGNYWMFYPGKR